MAKQPDTRPRQDARTDPGHRRDNVGIKPLPRQTPTPTRPGDPSHAVDDQADGAGGPLPGASQPK